MAVVIGTRNSFELVDGAGVEDVALGGALRPGPRVLRRFEVRDRRPATRLPAATAPASLESTTCEARPRVHPVVRFAVQALLSAAVCAALALVYLFGSGALTVPERTNVTYVQVGETLEDVAVRSAPGHDPDAVADRIRSLNHLRSDAIVPGQALTVPDGR
ncbi:LysM peptidoglycan-binding domain-containing protein [Actinosynnema sp. NPDC020468]|uniref:LysM peptidoglycan-binding domain-containing protein n=1 Tax=Actinosynnema sp. NPDC020468 TaxID=3154488 RepID=UPI0033D80E4D